MVDTLVPDYVDARKIFAQHALISGVMPISRFSRFCELLADSSGELQVSLQFFLDDKHRRIIDGKIAADVMVICQRCLDPATIHLEESFKLGIVEKEEHIAKLPGDIDPWMTTETKLVIAEFLEEQMILAMPIVSYHAEACKSAMSEDAGKSTGRKQNIDTNRDDSPFAILQKLKAPTKFN